jgi:hypothetical protein
MESYERTSFHRSCRGISDGMQAKGTIRNTGSPSGDCCTNRLAARERQAGPTGMAEGLAVLMKPSNVGGGKGPQLKADARSDDGREIGDEPEKLPSGFQESQAASHAMAFGDCVSLLREPDAANPHVRFDERGVETEAWWS